MVARIWHGWTSPEKASEYEKLLLTEIFPGIERKNVKGYRKISLLKRPAQHEVEFITIMIFDSIDAVREFAGEDYEKAYVPPKGQQVLSRYDATSRHYEVLHEFNY